MSDNNSGMVELLKYPVLVFSIVIALVIARYLLDLEFGVITEFSTDGIKFSEKSNATTLQAIIELEEKLNNLAVRLEEVEQNGPPTSMDVSVAKAAAFSASQTVSDATAKMAELRSEIPGGEDKRISGWIWIGNYDQEWSKSSISKLGVGQPVTMAPQKMKVGTEYKVLGNIVIRDGLPPNDKEYYRARKSLGVVPRGSIVTLLKQPEQVDREFAIQYWAEVEYVIPARK